MKSLLSRNARIYLKHRCVCEYASSRRWCLLIQRWLRRIAPLLPAMDLTVILVSPKKIALWNEQYRGHSGPTTVLSFLLSDAPARVVEVYLCLPEIRRRLGARIGLHEEVRKLLVHGILHGLGEDHQTESQELRMERKARVYLARLDS